MKTLLFLIACMGFIRLNAQVQFISSGKIVFEKKLNLEKEKEQDSWLASLRDKIPKFHSTQHILYFSEGKTLYEKGEDIEVKNAYLPNDLNSTDIIYSDLDKGIFSKKQSIFEKSVLLSDSIRHVGWEMTNETRMIAGFECHKATTIILDSVFIVAYYTDQITVSGGPMSYSGLPGMILGVAIPRMNLTIFANRVELMNPMSVKFVPPVEKMKLDYPGLINLIHETTKGYYEKEKNRYLINSLL